MALPAQQRLMEDDADHDLSDEQIAQLFREAETSLRARQEAAQSSLKPAQDGPMKLPKLRPGHIADAYLKTEGSITRADSSKLIKEQDRALAGGIKKIEDPIQVNKKKQADKLATAGSGWYNLPRTELTPEFRRDLQLLKMRDVLDPKRHYKKSDKKSDVPAFSQVGTIIEGPTEYYNGRLNKKERKKTFVEEVLAQEQDNGRFKNKYNQIQKGKTSGKKAFYKALKAKRNGRVEKR